MKRIVSAAVLMFALMTGMAMPAYAETPPSNISTNVVDNSGSLDASRVNEIVAQVQRETGYQFYVYFTNDFSGMSGAQWALQALTTSNLDSSKTILFAVAVKDRKYGSAFPSNSDISKKGSTMEQAAIPAMKDGKWTTAVESYANQLIAIAHKTDAESAQNSVQSDAAGGVFLTVITWIVGVVVGLGLIVLAFMFGPRGVRNLLDNAHKAKVIRRDVKGLLVSVPASISTLDDTIVKAKEQLSYAVGMYGELPVIAGKLDFAQENMQTAIKNLAKVSTTSYGIRGSVYRLRDLHDVALYVGLGEKNVVAAEKALKDLEVRASSIKFVMAQASGTASDLQAKLPEYEETVARVRTKFDEDYLADLVSSLASARKSVVTAQQYLAEASLAFADNNFDRADALTAGAGKDITRAKLSLSGFHEAAQEMSRFSINRDKIVRQFEKEISADTSENAHASVQSLIPAATAALKEASELQFLSGNPDKHLAKVLAPATEYRNEVERLVKVKGSVKDVKARANTKIKAMKVWQKTALVSNVKDYGVSLTALDKVAISEVEKIMKVDVAGVEWNLKDVSAYDLHAVTVFSKKLEILNGTMQSLVASIVEKTEKAIAAEQRRQEEVREVERKRKAQEQERKRKRDEEEEEDRRRRRRSSSSSSSSSSSYGGYSSYDSGSSSSSSGGSFGGGSDSSGGSF